MKTIRRVKIRLPELRVRAKWERKSSYNRYIESVKKFNNLAKKIIGKKIQIKRITQALEVYEYQGASAKGMPPKYWTASIENDTIVLDNNYRKVDNWKIL